MPGCCVVPSSGNQAFEGGAFIRQTDRCPQCGEKGKKVGVVTVKAMLAVSLRRLKSQRYRFCRTASCPVVYFAEDTDEVYTVDEVRERVFQKEPEADDVPVCYCFGYTPAAIRRDYEASGNTTVVEAIEAGVKAGQCACELRNPQGSCCLGNVRAVVDRMVRQAAPSVEKAVVNPLARQ